MMTAVSSLSRRAVPPVPLPTGWMRSGVCSPGTLASVCISRFPGSVGRSFCLIVVCLCLCERIRGGRKCRQDVSGNGYIQRRVKF